MMTNSFITVVIISITRKYIISSRLNHILPLFIMSLIIYFEALSLLLILISCTVTGPCAKVEVNWTSFQLLNKPTQIVAGEWAATTEQQTCIEGLVTQSLCFKWSLHYFSSE